ncbi:hypothetical protein MG290_13975 [Flavobacterium sp. CBA20B-1]|uniref:hypothetical protein n=1 Tax=unclassified Flavobacterium TaxID=196869 RepID=UPI0022242FD6|nr:MULTISPECIES: hypothetical protein [unclassified Flavobacterium]WCM42022.1 hypothetical protein MG290_13975 [Flavobacterium sp. CBA20B-1]
MKKDIRFIIPKPCKINIDEMNISLNDKVRFCENCKTNVHDIRDLSTDEIKTLKNSNNNNLCVIADSNQLLKSKKIRNITLSSLFIFSSLFSNEINAQYKSKLGSFEIKQSLIRTDSIEVSGFVYIKGTFGWRKISDYDLNIYSDGKLIDSQIIKKNKKFTLQYEYGIYDNISLIITHKGYEMMELKDIKFTNTKIKVYLAPKRFKVIGRFF